MHGFRNPTLRKADVDEATLPENGIMSWSVYEEEVEARSIRSQNNNQHFSNN
jgi:hypothetical protein